MKKLLSLIALVGLLAACQPENLETAFEKANAVATINVTTVDVQSGNIVTSATITSSLGTVAGQTITITGNPAITKQTVKVTAKYNGTDYSSDVNVNGLLAGGVASYNVTIVVGEVVSDYTISAVEKSSTDKVDTAYVDKATIPYNGKVWIENNSVFLLNGTVTYNVYTGATATENVTNANFKPVIDSYYDAYNIKVTKTPASLPITVSAYCYYTAYETRTTTTKVYDIKAVKGTESLNIGTVTVSAVSSTSAQYEEIAHPSHATLYHQGHGSSHGSGANAGGGIAFSE